MNWILETLLAVALIALVYREWKLRASREAASSVLKEIATGKTPPLFELPSPLSPLSRNLEALDNAMDHLRQQHKLSEANLHIILSSMQDGVLVTDGQRAVRVVNPTLRKVFDIQADVLGQSAIEALKEPDADRMIADALETGKPQERELEITRRGESTILIASVAPMRDASGEKGALVLFRDVTRLTRLEHVRRDFVANVSHELRTPLAIFQGWVENLQDNPEMSREDQAVAFSVLQKHSHRLNALVEDLLTLARLEASHDELDRDPLNIPKFLSELVRDWTTRVAAKDVTLRIDVQPDVHEVPADRLRIEQVFTNLLDNAFKYAPERSEIEIGAKRVGKFVEISVKDSGPGILSADLKHIFERFYRSDKARAREHGGTGLGLSIVKHIVKAHGGEVSATSRYGHGTTIHVRLPVD